jgi:PAS domain S-box-containing protein
MVRVPVSVPGEQVKAYAIYRDISERKHAQAQIQFQASLLDQVRNAVIAVDLEYKVVFWNSFAETLYQWKREEALGRNIAGLILPPSFSSAREKIIDLLKAAGYWDGEIIVQKKDGNTFLAYVHNASVRNAKGDVIGWVGVSTDITERKSLYRKLQESEERFRSFMNHLPGYAWIKNTDGGYVYMNRQLRQALPKHQEDWLGKRDRDLWEPDDAAEFERNDETVLRSNQPLQVVESWMHERQVLSMLVNKFPIRDVQGNPVMVAGTSIDITDRKRAEEQLKSTSEQLRALSASLQSAREKERTRIARELHDEMGSALTSFKWDLEEMDKTISGPCNEMDIASLRERIAAMTGLIDTTIHSVRRISSELRPSILDDLGLVAAIEWQGQQFESHTGITCQCNCFIDPVDLTRDQATALFRILQEAMTNILRHAQATRVSIALEEEERVLVLTVKDNGRGITEEERTGLESLGLIGMRERAHLIGGKIEVVGLTGTGTLITVRVPRT